MWTNTAIRSDLAWCHGHLANNPSPQRIAPRSWEAEEANTVAFTDACLEGIGIYFPAANIGLYARIPSDVSSEWIFFRECLAVACAVDIALRNSIPAQHVSIFSDNTNTVYTYHSLRAQPYINPLIRHSVDLLILGDHQIQVLYIPGEINEVADALSRHDFQRALSLSPQITINPKYLIPNLLLHPEKHHLSHNPTTGTVGGASL